MKQNLSRLSKSPYIQQLLDKTITQVFTDEKLLKDMTKELAKDLDKINLEKGFLNEKDKNTLKNCTGDFLGQISRKIINLTYENFISSNPHHSCTVIAKTQAKHVVDIFLHNIKSSSLNLNPSTKLGKMYESIRALVQQNLDLRNLFNNEKFDVKDMYSYLNLVLLENSETVCFKMTKISPLALEQKMLKEVLTEDSVANLLAQFFASLNYDDENVKELLPMHKAYIQSLYESMYSSNVLYGEREFDKMREFSDLGYIEYYITDGLEEVKVSCDELYDMLKKVQFDPEKLTNDIFKDAIEKYSF